MLQPLELIKTSKSSYSPAFHHSNTGMLEQNKTLLDFWALARWSSNLLHRCLRLGGSASFVLERDIEQDGAGTRCTVPQDCVHSEASKKAALAARCRCLDKYSRFNILSLAMVAQRSC